ncbi:MAG: PaaI family thioesterase [Aestuariivita sp.]|nr:PaaI family thioesterase [Aestuariivita sp.]
MVKNADLAYQFIDSMPYARALGMRLNVLGDGLVEISMDYDSSFVGDVNTGVIHGGAVSALMDTCCGIAVICHESAPRSTATIDLRIDYMRPATPKQSIKTQAECYHMTRNIAFTRATTFDVDTSRPVATASGAFTVERH